jgi:hypothetical protein
MLATVLRMTLYMKSGSLASLSDEVLPFCGS